MNFLEKLLLKSVRSTDQFYLDDSGKHVIFRNINGRTVPIQVTAEEYAEWLGEQGIQVDPADQTQLNQIESELEVLERAAEISPQMQSQYEAAFNQQRQQYYNTANKYYQQAVQSQAKKENVPPERLLEQRKQTYEKSKGETVSRASLPDRGWDSYTKALTRNILEQSGIKPNTAEYYVLQAFDSIMANAVSLAQEGISPSTINLSNLLKYELENGFPTIKAKLNTRYLDERQPGQEHLFDANIAPAFKNLKANMDQKTDAFEVLSKIFNTTYAKMFQDFEGSKKTFEGFKEGFGEGLKREDIPEDLPESYDARESTALYGIFRSYKNSPTAGANRVTLHALARLYDNIPEKDRALVASELSDGSKGLHAVHQSEFLSVWQRKTTLGMSVDIAQETEEILRLAAKAADMPTKQKILAMKEIAGRLGRIDGIHAFSMLNEENPSFRSFSKKWKDASINAGRQKGEGPDLVANIVDDDARRKVQYKNRTLKLPHQNKKTPKQNLEMPISAEEAKEEKSQPVKQERDDAFIRTDKGFVSPEGWVVKPGPNGYWDVYSPDSVKVGEIMVPKSKTTDEGMSTLIKTLNEARKIIDEHVGKPEPEASPELALFGFKKPVPKSEQEKFSQLEELVRSVGSEVKTKVPGAVFSVGGVVDVIQNKSNGKLFMVMQGQKPEVLDIEKLRPLFTQPEAEEPEEDFNDILLTEKSSNRNARNFVPGLSFSHKSG